VTYLGFGDQRSLCEVDISALTKETMAECQELCMNKFLIQYFSNCGFRRIHGLKKINVVGYGHYF